jgi:DNA topoisomerase-3
LPEVATTADMTARWESELNAISERNSSYQHFMGPLVTSLTSFIDQSKASLPAGLKGVKAGKRSFKRSFKRSRKKAAGTGAT